ncbi:MAG: TolC family protein [Prevotellaceae bacterium]|jgi:outer membrane protein TolC|nr:TolC family protein [Prevotellaceae bacterium]
MTNTRISNTIILSCLLLGGISLKGKAQEAAPATFSLQECLQYAVQNSYELHKAKFQTQEAEAGYREAQSSLLPQLNGAVSATDNLKLATSMFPGDMFGMPGEYIGVEMGVKYGAVAGLDLEQVVFDAGLFTGIKMSKNAGELALLKSRMTEEELIYSIGNAFYDITYSQNLLKNNVETLVIMDSIYTMMALQVAHDVTREIDLNRMKVNISNMRVDIQKTRATFSQQMNYLKVLMGMPLEYHFRVDDDNAGDAGDGGGDVGARHALPLPVPPLPFPTDNSNGSIPNRTELLILNKEKSVNELEIRQLRLGYLPTLSLTGSLGYSFENEKLTLGNSQFWSNPIALGLKLSVPIFDGGTRRHQIRQSQFRLRQVEEDIKQQQQTSQSDLQNAGLQMQVSYQSANAQRENMQVAEKSYRQGVMLYEEGLYSITDLLDTEKSYREAQSAYAYELSNYHKSIIELKKSEGTLNTLLNK